MTIIWGGSLAVLLNKLKNSLYKVEKIDIDSFPDDLIDHYVNFLLE